MARSKAEINLLDGLIAEVGTDLPALNLVLPSQAAKDGTDVVLFADGDLEIRLDRDETPAGHRLRRKGRNRVRVQLSDSLIAALGASLETERGDVLDSADLERGERWVVNYGNPNATKALHVGHLRQLAVGEALACMHEAAGAEVIRQTRIGDFGRNVGEALAGYRAFGSEVPLGSADRKGDRFIGECYARYVGSLSERPGPAPSADASLAREGSSWEDEAERLLAEWTDGGPASGEFEALRSWVLRGHEETMSRLGITMRRTLLESDYLAHGQALQRRAIDAGLVIRAESGATLYETGDSGYPYLLLCRPDGFPTQHLRYIATWDAIRDDCSGMRSIGVLGAEWEQMSRFTNELLGAMHGDADVHPHIRAIHGMVISGTSIVKSSNGDESVLVDEILDRVTDSDFVKELCDGRDWVDPEAVGQAILIGFFLGRPMNKRSPLSIEELLSPEMNFGCAWAQAMATVMDPDFDGEPDPAPDDPAYRALVVQSQMHRRILFRCLERTEILPLARFHFHRIQWYADQARSPRLARAMRTILLVGGTCLGLVAGGAPASAGPPTPSDALQVA